MVAILRSFIVGTLLLFSLTAAATSTTATGTPTTPTATETDASIASRISNAGASAADDIPKMFQAILDGITSYTDGLFNTVFKPNGNILIGGLAIIALAWLGMTMALEGGAMSTVMGDLFRSMFLIGIAYYFVNDGYTTIFREGIVGSMTKLADMVSPTGDASLKQGFYNYLTLQFDLFARVLDQYEKMSLFDQIMKFFPTLFIFVITGFIMLVASIFTMIAGLLIFIVLSITLAIGPILIPWMILRPTSHIFEGWLNYLIGCSLALVVLSIMTGIGFRAMDAVYATFINTGNQGFLPAALGGATVSALVAYMVGQASDIAKDLISGGKLGMGQLTSKIGGKAGAVGSGTVGKTVGGSVASAGNKAGSAAMAGLGERAASGDLFRSSGTRAAAAKRAAAAAQKQET